MINVVNGYPCLDCSDEALAKRGVDPATRGQLPLGAVDGGSAGPQPEKRVQPASFQDGLRGVRINTYA